MAAQVSPGSPHQSLLSFLTGLNTRPALVAACRQIICQAVDLLELEDCAIALLDEQGLQLRFLAPARQAVGHQRLAMTRRPLVASPLLPMRAERAPLLLPASPYDVCLCSLEDGSMRNLVCLPLFDRDQWLGALIASSAIPALADSRQIALLTLIAEQVVLVLTNAYQAELVGTAERARAGFLSLITHELRSPLNSINGYLDLALDGMAGELNEQQKEFLLRARAGSEYLYSLLEDLLLAARADAGQLNLRCESVVLQDLIDDVLEGLELVARDAEVDIVVEIPASFPVLRADSVRLQQVIRDLLSNAVRFTPAGGLITLGARILPASAEHTKGLAEISVRDTGYGIAAEYHERIFERFFRLSAADSGHVNGLGLGLAIIKLIVELHGGSVRVESAPGQGSTFTFTLDTLA